MMASRSGETLVARQQRSVERFGKRDVDGIIGREIVPQIPDARQKDVMRVTLQGKIGEIGALIEAASRDATRTFPERLGVILGIVARQLAELGETLVRDVSYREPQLWEKIDTFRREHIFTAITRLFEEGIRDGWVRTDIESRLVPAMFVGAANAILNPSQIFAMTAPPVVIFDTLIRILLGGILTEPGRRQLFVTEAKE